MLLRFEATNYRSILEPVELSMIAVDKDRPSTRGHRRDLRPERVGEVERRGGPRVAVDGGGAVAPDMGSVRSARAVQVRSGTGESIDLLGRDGRRRCAVCVSRRGR